MNSPKFRLFFRPFSPFSVKNQEKASLIHKKQALTTKKEKRHPKIANIHPTGRKKRQKEEGGSAKTGNVPPKKAKNDQKGEKTAERKHKKCHHRLKNQKNLSKLPRFPDFNGFSRILPHICCIFTPSAPCFAAFLRCFCLVHCCFFFLLLYFAILFRFFHCFFTVFGSFFPLFSHFFHLLRHLPPLVLDFSAFGFLFSVFFRLFRYSAAVFAPFLPSAVPYPPQKSTFFVRFFAFFFCFFACTIVLRTVFCFFPVFFLRLSAFAEEKSKIRRFVYQTEKIVRTVQTTVQEGKNAVKRGKSALRAGTIPQKQAFFSLIT